ATAVVTPPSVPLTIQSRASGQRARQIAIGGTALLAVSVVAVLAVWQWRSGAKPASVTAADSAQHNAAPTAGSISVAATPPAPATVNIDSLRGASLAKRDTARKPAAVAQANTVPRTDAAGGTGNVKKPADSVKTAATAPVVSGGTQPSASDELQRIMRDADSDIGTNDSNEKRAKARDIIRKLNLLSPKLSMAADQGWAAFYIGTSHATLGENDKACAAIKRAYSLSGQSPMLRSNSEQWTQTLSCGL
ncbi:MAG: hypothetical protein M3Y64_03260, partial [Gemmatimonadota bacterium]|nr:hypothetical protein [Gemmatimonadota bacterium]